MFCFRCKLMFEKKKKNKAHKPIKAHMATKAHKLTLLSYPHHIGSLLKGLKFT